MANILISYRRTDSDVFAGRVRDKIADRFGPDSVFMDIDNIPFGRDFRTHVRDALGKSDVVIVVIGSRWLGTTKSGLARILEETDPVRIEVETALQKGVPVIPILAGDTRMPKPTQLPDTLKDFAFINAATVDTGRDFHPHMERVVRSIEAILDGRPDEAPGHPTKPAPAPTLTTPEPKPRSTSRYIGLAIALMAGAAIVAATAIWGPGMVSFWSTRPSWCSNAGYGVEKTICGDRSFFEKDRKLNDRYSLLLRARPENAKTVRKDQADWLERRNQCKSDDTDCIHRAYDTRIAQLESQLSSTGN
jgi:uncharacterized protein YecT (DUF1311 family)